jgi:hypothetical protein
VWKATWNGKETELWSVSSSIFSRLLWLQIHYHYLLLALRGIATRAGDCGNYITIIPGFLACRIFADGKLTDSVHHGHSSTDTIALTGGKNNFTLSPRLLGC